MKTCPYCAEEIQDAARICPYCRSDLTQPPYTGAGGAPAARTTKSSNAGTWIIVAVVVGVGGIFVIGVLIALLLPAIGQAREAARRAQCKNNLKQIGLALHNYHDVYKTFPPAYVPDENGRPMHSWRVLILPYLDQQPLYDSYDFSQPWDSPANQAVLKRMPPTYRCPSVDGPGATTTSYAAVFGPDCVFTGEASARTREITDGTSNTVMVGEAPELAVPWTKPQDVDVTANGGLGDPLGFASEHAGGAHFLFADGSVRFIAEDIPQQTLENLFRRNDGNRVQGF